MIELAVGVCVTGEFRTAVGEVSEDDWCVLKRREGEYEMDTGQQYAEVCYVTNWIGHSKNSPDYRFMAVREPLRNPTLPGMVELSVPTMQMGDGGWYKITGAVRERKYMRC